MRALGYVTGPIDRVRHTHPVERARHAHPIKFVKRFGPRVFDTRLIVGLCLCVGLGVFVVVWNAKSLRLVVDGHIFAWVPLVAFGIVWSAGRDVAWRTAAGVMVGAIVAVSALWGGMAFLPVASDLAWGLWVGVVIAGATAICHLLPRLVSFGAMTVGFATGMGAALYSSFDPATSAVSYFNVLMAVILALIIGTIGAQLLHAVVVALDGVHVAHWSPRSLRYRAANGSSRRVKQAS